MKLRLKGQRSYFMYVKTKSFNTRRLAQSVSRFAYALGAVICTLLITFAISMEAQTGSPGTPIPIDIDIPPQTKTYEIKHNQASGGDVSIELKKTGGDWRFVKFYDFQGVKIQINPNDKYTPLEENRWYPFRSKLPLKITLGSNPAPLIKMRLGQTVADAKTPDDLLSALSLASEGKVVDQGDELSIRLLGPGSQPIVEEDIGIQINPTSIDLEATKDGTAAYVTKPEFIIERIIPHTDNPEFGFFLIRKSAIRPEQKMEFFLAEKGGGFWGADVGKPLEVGRWYGFKDKVKLRVELKGPFNEQTINVKIQEGRIQQNAIDLSPDVAMKGDKIEAKKQLVGLDINFDKRKETSSMFLLYGAILFLAVISLYFLMRSVQAAQDRKRLRTSRLSASDLIHEAETSYQYSDPVLTTHKPEKGSRKSLRNLFGLISGSSEAVKELTDEEYKKQQQKRLEAERGGLITTVVAPEPSTDKQDYVRQEPYYKNHTVTAPSTQPPVHQYQSQPDVISPSSLKEINELKEKVAQLEKIISNKELSGQAEERVKLLIERSIHHHTDRKEGIIASKLKRIEEDGQANTGRIELDLTKLNKKLGGMNEQTAKESAKLGKVENDIDSIIKLHGSLADGQKSLSATVETIYQEQKQQKEQFEAHDALFVQILNHMLISRREENSLHILEYLKTALSEGMPQSHSLEEIFNRSVAIEQSVKAVVEKVSLINPVMESEFNEYSQKASRLVNDLRNRHEQLSLDASSYNLSAKVKIPRSFSPGRDGRGFESIINELKSDITTLKEASDLYRRELEQFILKDIISLADKCDQLPKMPEDSRVLEGLLQELFSNAKLKSVLPRKNDPFNPSHQTNVGNVMTQTEKKQTIAEVVQRGFKYNEGEKERTIRVAAVKVYI